MNSRNIYISVQVHAIVVGLTMYKIGLGCYFLLIIASIFRFRHQNPQSTARRVLLPFAIVTLLMNSTFAILIFIGEGGSLKISPPSVIIMRLLLSLPIIINDALFVSLSVYFVTNGALNSHKMYRTAVLFSWKLLPLILPACIYLTLFVTGIIYINIAGHSPELEESEAIHGLFIVCTLVLNTLLAFMVTAKLVMARRAALAMGIYMKGPASQYLTTINTIVESSAMWILPTALYLSNFFDCASTIIRLHPTTYFCAAFPSFFLLFMMTSALSPAILLYRIAHNMQYTPTPDVGKSPRSVQQSESRWLYDTEKQLVRMDKGKGRAVGTNSDMSSGALHGHSMRPPPPLMVAGRQSVLPTRRASDDAARDTSSYEDSIIQISAHVARDGM